MADDIGRALKDGLKAMSAQGGSQRVPCSYCVGSGSAQCTGCSGVGQFND